MNLKIPVCTKEFISHIQIGVGKIYTQEEIDKAKRVPSFEREYNLQYGYGLGNIFLPPEIDKACSIKYNPHKINHACPIQWV